MSNFTRRSVLKSLAAGSASLVFAGYATAAGNARYLVSGRGKGLKKRLEKKGFSVTHTLADGNVLVVKGSSGATDELQNTNGVDHATLDALFRLKRPKEVEAHEKATDDELFPFQWDKMNTDVPEAHKRATGAGRSIAVIDTGVDTDHPDLPNRTAATGRMNELPTEVEFHDELNDNGTISTSIRTGFDSVIRPALGWFVESNHVIAEDCSFVGYHPSILNDPDDHPVSIDVVDHGTHVAGIAGASNDGTTGVVGTAPDVDIVPLRVFNWITEEVDTDGDGKPDTRVANILASFTSIFLAIDYASRLGVDAMNLSIGTPPLPPQSNIGGIRGIGEQVLQTATARGSLVVVSAGNSATSLQQGGLFTLPNSLAGAMSISATGPDDKLSFYSNFGTNEVDIGAPGGGYETLKKTLCVDGEFEKVVEPDGDDDDCAPDETEVVECETPEHPFPFNLVLSSVPREFWGADHAFFAGTSMAAPQVTGTAALLREVEPDANARRLEQAIEQGAELETGKNDPQLGAGRLSAAGALDAISNGGGDNGNRNGQA